MAWKIGISRSLNVSNTGNWDGQAAEDHIFAWAGWPDDPDPGKARKAFLFYNSDAPENKGSYKFPIADVVDGELVVERSGLAAAASRLSQKISDVPEELIAKAVKIKDYYFAKANKESKKKSETDEGVWDFVITKASLGADGVKRWAATVSKFEVDGEGDEVTKAFYEKVIDKIDKGIHPYPALVVSHYDDGRADVALEPVPEVFKAGIATALYVDGDKPKAKGIFTDSPLGNAAYEAIKSDLASKLPHEERARISMAFRPDIDNGIEKADDGHLKYTDGIIRHFALTRVPIVKETEIMVQKSSVVRKTRFDDAKTIVGEELATELDKAYKSISKSKSATEDTLIEKAKTGDAAQKHMINGKFSMGDCISTKLSEGKDRKQAIAICLSMAQDKPTLKMDMMEMFDIEACKQEYIDKGFSVAAAEAACMSQMMKLNDMMQGEGETTMNMQKAALAPTLSEAIALYVKEGKTSEEATKLYKSEEAVKARILDAAQRGDLDAIVKAVVSDDEITIVKANEDAEKVAEVAAKSVNQTAVQEKSETVEKTEATEATTGESKLDKSEVTEVEKGVEKTEPNKEKAETASTETANPTDSLITMFKATLANEALSRTEKTAVLNTVLDQLGSIAKAGIQNTPATAEDQAMLLKSAMQEAMKPVMTQLVLLETKNAELEAIVKSGLVTPRSKQLIHTQQIEKSGITGDTGGALNASQIAEATVRPAIRY